jgi:hypothetical protein
LVTASRVAGVFSAPAEKAGAYTSKRTGSSEANEISRQVKSQQEISWFSQWFALGIVVQLVDFGYFFGN